MYRIRAIEEEISERYSQGRMRCPTHLSVGQEAVPAAFSEIVSKNDFTVSSHRGHAHYLAKGGNLKSMLAEIYGKKTGSIKYIPVFTQLLFNSFFGFSIKSNIRLFPSIKTIPLCVTSSNSNNTILISAFFMQCS